MKRIVLISTGGTIEKTYNELSGLLANEVAVLDVMLSQIEVRGVSIERLRLMNKDSTDMTPEDHELIANTACRVSKTHDGVVIVHGTDRLTTTGQALMEIDDTVDSPIILTGAMRPFAMKNTDAVQNLVEALLAVQLVDKGVYLAMHNQLLQFPGVVKDGQLGTFVKVRRPS